MNLKGWQISGIGIFSEFLFLLFNINILYDIFSVIALIFGFLPFILLLFKKTLKIGAILSIIIGGIGTLLFLILLVQRGFQFFAGPLFLFAGIYSLKKKK